MADEQSGPQDPNQNKPQTGSGDELPDATGDDLGFSQDDIDALLIAAKDEAGASAGQAETTKGQSDTAETFAEAETVQAAEVSAPDAPQGKTVAADELELPTFDEAEVATAATQSINLLRDVQLHVKVELGRTYMFVEDVLRLGEGSVVELDKLAGDPVDVYVNDRLVARGEVLVLNDNFCVRVSEIVERSDARRAG